LCFNKSKAWKDYQLIVLDATQTTYLKPICQSSLDFLIYRRYLSR